MRKGQLGSVFYQCRIQGGSLLSHAACLSHSETDSLELCRWSSVVSPRLSFYTISNILAHIVNSIFPAGENSFKKKCLKSLNSQGMIFAFVPFFFFFHKTCTKCYVYAFNSWVVHGVWNSSGLNYESLFISNMNSYTLKLTGWLAYCRALSQNA